ncbi:hypothetical protein K4K51_000883 [Colletotrichum sp. SAR 10_75]|nr:hypothetical protein K4K51_000883 [Colletotrichum sp. SAR 10_75]
MSKTLQTDILAVLQKLGSDWNLFKHPVPSDHPAIKDLDSLLDPGRKNAILRFLSALQQLGNIVTEEEDLPILVALGFTGFEQIAYTPSAVFARMLSTHSFDQGRARRMHNEAKNLQARSEHAFFALPAAYFVELLQFLKNQPATANVTIPLLLFDGSIFNIGSVPRGSILEKLFNRRPDLGDLLVSCRNTNEVVPYIDLVNEALKSALRYLQTNNNKLEKRGMRIPAHNADNVEKDTQDSSDYDAAYYPSGSIESSPSANKAALLSDAVNIDYALHDSVINGNQEPVAPDDQVGLAFIKIQLLPRIEGESLTRLFRILKTDFMFNCLVISVGPQSNTARKASGNVATQLEGFLLCGKNGEDAGTSELQRLGHFNRTLINKSLYSPKEPQGSMLVFSEVVTIHVKTSITGDLPIFLDLRGSPATVFELVPKQLTGDGPVARFECEIIAPKTLVVFMKGPAALFGLNVILRAAGPDSPKDGDSACCGYHQ